MRAPDRAAPILGGMGRVDLATANDLLWQDLMALYDEAQTGVVGADGVRSRHAAGRFLTAIRAGRAEGRLVTAVDRLMRDARYGAVLDDSRHPEALLEQRIVLATRPYSFLWPQATLDLARQRARRLGASRPRR
jgi:hypothetical protein